MADITQSASPHPARPVWLRGLLCIGIFAYALLFGEIFLRALQPQPLVPRYVTGGADGIRANIPDTRFRQWTPEVDVRIHYNAAGMRDDRPPPPLEKAPGECRIALLGDSYFVGFESGWEDSYAMQLEKALRDGGRDCRVLNFAVSGFGHAEMLRALESRVRRWQPDHVLVSIHQTDGMDNIRAGLFRVQPDGSVAPTGATFLPGVEISDTLNAWAIYRWAQENSHLYSAVREWAGINIKRLLATFRLSAARDAEAEEPAEDAATDRPSYAANVALNEALARALLAESRAMGADLLFVDIPSSPGRTRYVSIAPRLLGADMVVQLPIVDLAAPFARTGGPDVQLYLEKGHRHWTPLGNRLAAEVTARELLRTMED